MVAEEHRRGADAAPLRNLHHGRRGKQRAACAAERAVGDDLNTLGVAEVDDFLLRQAGVVLDLVDSGDDAAAGEELFEVFLAVLFFESVSSEEENLIERAKRVRTLLTPMPRTLPVSGRASICFHASVCFQSQMMSRLPSGSVGNLSSLPKTR